MKAASTSYGTASRGIGAGEGRRREGRRREGRRREGRRRSGGVNAISGADVKY
jgi:hypothetical protein